MDKVTFLEAFRRPCKYRFGVAKKGKLFVKCKLEDKIYDIEEAIAVCGTLCSLR